ncbi:MAG: glycosyltransferase family 2 protein [Paracoccaceae bacterium]
MRTTVIASMRNEGAFIVEWVSWYRMLGFTNIVVVTNDCVDRSPELLDALQKTGWLKHQPCVVPEGERVTITKLKAARRLPEVANADWILICDVDEYLVIHRGAGLLADLIGAGAPEFLGMSINWRVFGNQGVPDYQDMPVHRQFFKAVGAESHLSKFVKSLHRKPKWFARLGEHGPVQLKPERMQADGGGAWGDPGLVWVNSAGGRIDSWGPGAEQLRELRPEDCDYSGAQFNHYMLRSGESFSLKRGTLSPTAAKPRYTAKYQMHANLHDLTDKTALRYAAAFDRAYAEVMAVPQVARLHHLCCADHVRLIAERAGQRAEDDPRYQRYMELAGQV